MPLGDVSPVKGLDEPPRRLAPVVGALRIEDDLPDRLGQFLRRLRRHQQPGPPGLDEVGKARQLRGDHRPAGGKALHDHHAKGFPASRGNDRAKAVLQQPQFLPAGRLADEMDLPRKTEPGGQGLQCRAFRSASRHDQVEIALASQQGHRLQQHVDPFPRIEAAQEEQIGFRSGSVAAIFAGRGTGAANCSTSTPLGIGTIRRNSGQASRNIPAV